MEDYIDRGKTLIEMMEQSEFARKLGQVWDNKHSADRPVEWMCNDLERGWAKICRQKKLVHVLERLFEWILVGDFVAFVTFFHNHAYTSWSIPAMLVSRYIPLSASIALLGVIFFQGKIDRELKRYEEVGKKVEEARYHICLVINQYQSLGEIPEILVRLDMMCLEIVKAEKSGCKMITDPLINSEFRLHEPTLDDFRFQFKERVRTASAFGLCSCDLKPFFKRAKQEWHRLVETGEVLTDFCI